jgi:hypothetical protein
MATNISKEKLVEIIWEDACTIDEWRDIDDNEKVKLTTCRTCGYLIEKTDKFSVVVQTIGDEDAVFATVVIPNINIISTFNLVVKSKDKFKGKSI